MRQLFRDLKERLKGERKTQVIAGIVGLCVLWLLLGDAGPRRAPVKPTKPVSSGPNEPSEQWKDLIERFNGELKQMSNVTAQNQEKIAALEKSMGDYEATTAEIFKKILERLAEVQNSNGSANASNNGQARTIDDALLDGGQASPDELDTIGPADDIKASAPPKPQPKKLAFIGPGDSVRVKLLAGVNAPTDGTPYPVVFKLDGDVIGPDGVSLPLGEARVVAASQGSLTDARALFRMTRLSIRLPNGRRKEFAVDGWIVGEDGIRGMEGVLIDPIGKAIGGAGMAGALAGLGQGIAAANTVNRQDITGDTSYINANKVPEYAGGVALSSAATEWQKIIEQRLAQLTPVVQVLSGREGTAVFSQSLAIPDLYEQLDDEDPAVAFRSLD